jgi:1-phosphatidylinositol-3-phosphate 5-kinase
MVEFELRILYPKRFQALRRFYCGSHTDFISSILRVVPWESSGGKTNSPFYKSHDEKYIIKEVKKSEFKMFMEFGPTYFDYMVKAFFHSYPCALAKILGAYVVKVNSSNNQAIKYKKYILVSENLNLGIKASEE